MSTDETAPGASTESAEPPTESRLLVAMAFTDTRHEDELLALAAECGATLCYLQGEGRPTLPAALDDLAADGRQRCTIVATTGPDGLRAGSWVRRVAGDWVRRHDGRLAVRIAMAPSGRPVTAASYALPSRPVLGTEAPLTSPAWEQPPDYHHHVLVCRGPRCTARGADETWDALREEISRTCEGDEILAAQTGCLYPCNQAPVVKVSPGEAWHAEVDAERARELVRALSVDG